MANVSSFSGAMPVIPGGTVEIAYAERTSDYTIASTTVAGAADVFASDVTFVADGGPYLIDFFCGRIITASGGPYLNLYLVNGAGSEQGMLGVYFPGGNQGPGFYRVRVQPAAGSVLYNVRVIYNTAGVASLSGGSGSGTSQVPIALRVSKIVNQNDGLKPFWTPPIVTQLPSQATVGDQVLYAADATNGVYWQLQYDGLGTYPWKFVGGPPLTAQIDTDENIVAGTTTYTALATAGPSITLALAGDYVISQGCRGYPFATNQTLFMSYDIGATSASDNDSVLLDCASGFGENGSRTRLKTAIAASTAIVSKYKHSSTGAGANFMNRWMTITPVRVKAP